MSTDFEAEMFLFIRLDGIAKRVRATERIIAKYNPNKDYVALQRL